MVVRRRAGVESPAAAKHVERSPDDDDDEDEDEPTTWWRKYLLFLTFFCAVGWLNTVHGQIWGIQSDDLGPLPHYTGNLSDTFGEVTLEGFSQIGALLSPPFGAEDRLLDVGSGEGTLILELLLRIQAGVGVENNAERHEKACAALGITERRPVCERDHVRFILSDFRETPEVFNEASIVWAHNALFGHSLMLDLFDIVTRHSLPGQILLSQRPLPGCHLGWVYMQSAPAQTTYSQDTDIHMYLRAPREFGPDGMIVPSSPLRKQHDTWLQEALLSFRTSSGSRAPTATAAAVTQLWGLAHPQADRIVATLCNENMGAVSLSDERFAALYWAHASLNGQLELAETCLVKEVVAHALDRRGGSVAVPNANQTAAALASVQRGLMEPLEVEAFEQIWTSSFPTSLEAELPAREWEKVRSFWQEVQQVIRGEGRSLETMASEKASGGSVVLNWDTIESDLMWNLLHSEL